MFYCGWDKRTDIVTNTTPAILYTKMYYCGWKKRTDSVTNTTSAILIFSTLLYTKSHVSVYASEKFGWTLNYINYMVLFLSIN